ncbi:DUF4125 family protein [archaeon]|nr:DUF4125 family protein [archaeon]
MKDELIKNVVESEWDQFSRVNNFGGKASCQEDFNTFNIMRSSQAEAWPEELLESYYQDLLTAKTLNRNLMTEKYARMMETTLPEEFAKIADRMPVVSDAVLEVIEKIIQVALQWKVETFQKSPNLAKRSRPIFSASDTRYTTSYETYLRCELRTYSSKTISLYAEMIMKYLENGVNLEDVYLLNMVKKYGYDSIETAEKYAQ